MGRTFKTHIHADGTWQLIDGWRFVFIVLYMQSLCVDLIHACAEITISTGQDILKAPGLVFYRSVLACSVCACVLVDLLTFGF